MQSTRQMAELTSEHEALRGEALRLRHALRDAESRRAHAEARATQLDIVEAELERVVAERAVDRRSHARELQAARSKTAAGSVEREGTLLQLSRRVQEYYVQMLRAESHRKALVYQKKYLLLLLGGFQDMEPVTVALLASLQLRPDYEGYSRRARALARFRAAAHGAIAVVRLRILVRKWTGARQASGRTGTIAGLAGESGPSHGHAAGLSPLETLRTAPQRS